MTMISFSQFHVIIELAVVHTAMQATCVLVRALLIKTCFAQSTVDFDLVSAALEDRNSIHNAIYGLLMIEVVAASVPIILHAELCVLDELFEDGHLACFLSHYGHCDLVIRVAGYGALRQELHNLRVGDPLVILCVDCFK